MEALRDAGLRELRAAKTALLRAQAAATCSASHPLQGPRTPWWIYGSIVDSLPACAMQRRRRAGEESARAALRHAVGALNYLEDLDEALDAHRLVHEVGAYVSWHYGCTIQLTDDGWRWTCPVILSHLRFGNSAGFTAPRICSICGEDISECAHLPGRVYRVRVSDTEICPCGSSACEIHNTGDIIEAAPHAVVKDADLHEISVVPRPRDPLARTSEFLFPQKLMSSMLGGREIPPSVKTMECYHCRQACTGFWDGQALGRVLGVLPST